MMLLKLASFGALGVLCRYLVDRGVGNLVISDFPISTFIINCIGSFLIGVVYIATKEGVMISEDLSVAITAGFLGGFTTFSAYSLQTLQLLERGQILVASSYFIGSPIVGLLFAAAGVYFSRLGWR